MMRYLGFIPLDTYEKDMLIAYARQKKAIIEYVGIGLDIAHTNGIFLDFIEALDLFCSSADLFYKSEVFRTKRSVVRGHGSNWGLQQSFRYYGRGAKVYEEQQQYQEDKEQAEKSDGADVFVFSGGI